MSKNKQTRKELLEIEVRMNELERMRPFLRSSYYYSRFESLKEKYTKLQEKIDSGELAPDIQYLITEE